MPAGLPAATITVRRFLAKVWGASANPSRMAASIFASSAEANTSAGAPCSSCVRRVELPAKFSATSVPEFSSSKLSLSSPKASVSEEAAKTVKADSPLASEPPDPPHPKRTGRSAATTTQHESFAPTDPIYAPTGAGSPCQQRLKDASCYRCAGPESLCKCTKFLEEVLSVALASRRIFVPSSPEDAYLRDDQDDAEQLTGLGTGSPRYSPSCRERPFSETRKPSFRYPKFSETLFPVG